MSIQEKKPHNVYIQNEAKQFICPHCDKTTNRQNTMFYHIEKKHTEMKKHQCTECTKGFVNKSGLQTHMAQVHPHVQDESNPYLKISWSCPCCDHTCRMKANMAIHIARKHGSTWIPPYSPSCGNCKKEVGSPTAYYYHAIQCLTPPPEMEKHLEVYRHT
jgi:hypothetical protein